MTMTSHIKVACLATLALAFVVLPAQAWAESKTYALIVAHNGSMDADVEPLRYADDDGARFYEMFRDYADDVTLLTTLDEDSQKIFPQIAPASASPTRANLADQVSRLAKQLEADRENGIETELFLVFSGHGNVDESGEGYLNLADARLKRSDLYRDVIRPLNADFTNLIIDACHAYFMVRSRGDEWRDDRSGQRFDAEFEAYLRGGENTSGNETIGVILSTAGAAEVHEWSRFRSGVFSHQLRSGLLGAADVDGDGRITYPELAAYLASANASVTNPRAKIHVFVEGPRQDRARSITDIERFRDATFLELPEGVGGRMHVEDARGLRYVDMHLDSSISTRIALLRNPVDSRPYYLRKDGQQAVLPTSAATLDAGALAYAARPDQARGSVDESFRTELFATSFGPSFVAGYSAGLDTAEARETGLVAPAPSAWTLDLMPELTASGSPLKDLSALQYNAALALEFQYRQTLGIGPYVGYGFTPDSALDAHRISVGVQGSYVFLRTAVEAAFRLRVGHQTLVVNTGESRTDPFGLRGEAAITLGWAGWNAVKPHLIAGASADVVSRANLERSEQSVALSPFAGVGFRF